MTIIYIQIKVRIPIIHTNVHLFVFTLHQKAQLESKSKIIYLLSKMPLY